MMADNAGMNEREEDSIEVENWCAGYRYAEIRPLGIGEIAVIRDAARRHAWRLVRLAPVPLAVGFLLVLGGAWLPTVAPVWINRIWLLCMVTVPFIGLPVWFLSIRSSWKSCAGLYRDARVGEAWNFESPQSTDTDEVATPPLAVLPASHHAFVPGTLMLSETALSITEVAKGPSYAMRVPIATTHDAENESAGDFLRRTLNGSEQGEIAIAIRRLRWPGKRLLLIPFLLAWAIYSLRTGPVTFSSETATGLMLTVLCAMGVARYFRGFALAIKMRRDLQTGWAITAPAKEPRPQQGPFVEEFLPHSRLLWTVNGGPAAWRNLKPGPLALRR